MYKMLVAPLVVGVSGVCVAAGTAPLSKTEEDSGVYAFSCLAYQYGAVLDAKLLVALWVVGVSLPRLTQFLADQRKHRTVNATPSSVGEGMRAANDASAKAQLAATG